MWNAILFDLDGTLLDSQRDIYFALSAALQEKGYPVSPEDLGSLRGAHMSLVLAHYRGLQARELDPAELAEFSKAYRRNYLECMFDHTAPFPGVLEALERLRGVPKAVATSKPLEYANRLINHFHIGQYFDAVVGCENLPPKPDPAVFRKAAEELGVDPGHCLAVGDTSLDMLSAGGAGCDTCLVQYESPAMPVADCEPDYRVSSFAEMLKLVQGGKG